MRPFVLDGESASIARPFKCVQNGLKIHVADAELAEFTALEALEMHVPDSRTDELERGETVDARALEVDRVEIHPDVRPIDRVDQGWGPGLS